MSVFIFAVFDRRAEGHPVNNIFKIVRHICGIFHEFELRAYQFGTFTKKDSNFVSLLIYEFKYFLLSILIDDGGVYQLILV